jgi:hypothetical protein
MIEVREEYIDTHKYSISFLLGAFATDPIQAYPATVQSPCSHSVSWYTQALFSKDVKSLKGYGQGAETVAFTAGAEEDKTGEQEEGLVQYV